MERIVPHLWFDKEAKEAALFYTSLFEQSKVLNVQLLKAHRQEMRRVLILSWLDNNLWRLAPVLSSNSIHLSH